jgi:hypothetical protein
MTLAVDTVTLATNRLVLENNSRTLSPHMLGSNAVVDMDHNIIENRHVFMKTDKTSGD